MKLLNLIKKLLKWHKKNPCRKHYFNIINFDDCPVCGWSGKINT
jgi:hypothetical protein